MIWNLPLRYIVLPKLHDLDGLLNIQYSIFYIRKFHQKKLTQVLVYIEIFLILKCYVPKFFCLIMKLFPKLFIYYSFIYLFIYLLCAENTVLS